MSRSIDKRECTFADTVSTGVDVFVCEGWWHPNVKSGQVHNHPARPDRAWPVTMHRSCEPVYTKREGDDPRRALTEDQFTALMSPPTEGDDE